MRTASEREMAGFLLGLGIGLIVGIVCQPRSQGRPGKGGTLAQPRSAASRPLVNAAEG